MFPVIAFPVRARAMALALGVGLGVAPAPSTSLAGPAYDSTFEGYRVFTDTPAGGWASANRSAADAGGWKAYAKAARASSSGTVTAPSAASASGGHDSHAGPDGHVHLHPAATAIPGAGGPVPSGQGGHAPPGTGAQP